MISLRRQLFVGAIVVFLNGLGIGYLVATEFNFDRHSYMGGVSYVVTRSDPLSAVATDPLTACQEYLDAGMNELDGYMSKTSFLDGCRDAVAEREIRISVSPRTVDVIAPPDVEIREAVCECLAEDPPTSC